MIRPYTKTHLTIVIFALLFFGLQFGCSKGGCSTPMDCQENILNALSKDNKEQFFNYVLDPPTDVEDRDLAFEWYKSRFEPFFGGEAVSEEKVGEIVVVSIAYSTEFAESHGMENAPPLLLAFENKEGWKIDLKYTEQINDNIFN
jgi:hypothetical protein